MVGRMRVDGKARVARQRRGSPPDASFEEPLRAAALRYDAAADPAPRVVARGEGHLARLIIERARAHGIPVWHDPDLAADLARLNVGEAVPSRVYYAVAKVLAFVYALDERHKEQTRNEPHRARSKTTKAPPLVQADGTPQGPKAQG